ncbi:hypothetical protein [Novosphingobium gossypii]|uniref:hypothetical protein n=1 Tax=Novosphingobium gossypii TaxID=1604774 RepID=UPI003D1FE4DC
MLHNDFHVVRVGTDWAVRIGGEALAAFASQKAALNRAIDAAHEAGMAGNAAQVLVQDGFAEHRAAWVFGRHPYPPTA